MNILSRKEREHSGIGRCFTEQPYRQRLNQTCAEANINKFINPNTQYQILSDTEAELGRKIGSINSNEIAFYREYKSGLNGA